MPLSHTCMHAFLDAHACLQGKRKTSLDRDRTCVVEGRADYLMRRGTPRPTPNSQCITQAGPTQRLPRVRSMHAAAAAAWSQWRPRSYRHGRRHAHPRLLMLIVHVPDATSLHAHSRGCTGGEAAAEGVPAAKYRGDLAARLQEGVRPRLPCRALHPSE